MRTLYLCGAGNGEVARLALAVNRHGARWDRIALLDDDPAKLGVRRLGIEVIGSLEHLATVDPAESEVANLVARSTRTRLAVRRRLLGYGIPFARLVGPDVDTEGVQLPDDIVVCQHAVLGPDVRIGPGTCVYTGAVVGQEATLGEGCVIAPNAVLNGRVTLGQGVYIGANATILPELAIGAWATIGAGSAVMRDVPEGASAIGVPADVLGAGEESSPAARLGAGELAARIEGVWRELLRLPTVGHDVNFFDVGGTSLLAVQARARLREVTGQEVSVVDLFRFTTIRALAGHLADGPTTAETPDRGPERLRRLALLRQGARN
ncbi:MAG TPA: phosphopantetheine-binding protein [Gemmatimonadales bacterium]|nr:phosphopantetheine-binding protein [Gemmatimonadales bacterium]